MSRRITVIFASLMLLAIGGPLVFAQRTISARPRRFKSCVAIVTPPNDPLGEGVGFNPGNFAQSQVYPANPYFFYVLNQRTDIKPDGWEFYNPAAPGAVS